MAPNHNLIHTFLDSHRHKMEKWAQHRDQYREHMHSIARKSLDSSINALENVHKSNMRRLARSAGLGWVGWLKRGGSGADVMTSVAVHTGELSNFRLEGRLAAARESYLDSLEADRIRLAEQK